MILMSGYQSTYSKNAETKKTRGCNKSVQMVFISIFKDVSCCLLCRSFDSQTVADAGALLTNPSAASSLTDRSLFVQ